MSSARRAVYIHVGAMMREHGMAANVRFPWIIPGQKELVAAKHAGREPNPIHGLTRQQRCDPQQLLSRCGGLFAHDHGNHFPFTYATRTDGWCWLALRR